MSLFGSTGDGGAAAAQAAQQAQTTADEQDIDQQFAGFTPEFYKQAGTDYTNAVTPGMMQDYQTTKNNLTYSLARGGILNSGAAVQRNQSLQDQLSQNESQIANNAQNQSNQLQANVDTQKNTLYSQAEAGATPSVINAQAQAANSQLRAPAPIQPLGELFANWSQQYLAPMGNNTGTSSGTPSVWNQLANSGVGTVSGGAGTSYMVQ